MAKQIPRKSQLRDFVYIVAMAVFVGGAAFANHLWHQSSEFDRIISACDEQVRLNPYTSSAYFNRALAYEKQGLVDEALRDYQRAYELGDRSEWLLRKLKRQDRLPRPNEVET